ncbi:hypothetical protein EVAR_64314_1 [Eumeta japonica]|uniref:Uncharacterized protein n=1 Tax=Eumeta variegata TaxID=151549 RepID=A0A4C2A7R1_EUMVA|nr:hypothetical protein EVAR_64314_1 [Eumeta japonica]
MLVRALSQLFQGPSVAFDRYELDGFWPPRKLTGAVKLVKTRRARVTYRAVREVFFRKNTSQVPIKEIAPIKLVLLACADRDLRNKYTLYPELNRLKLESGHEVRDGSNEIAV